MGLRRWARCALPALVATVWMAVSPPVTSAATPQFAYSVYVTTSSTVAAYNQGCSLAGLVGAGSRPSDAFTVLDFGYPMYESGYGTLLITSSWPFVSLGQIEGIVEQYGKGYWDCSPAGTKLRVGVGENTSTRCPRAGRRGRRRGGASKCDGRVAIRSRAIRLSARPRRHQRLSAPARGLVRQGPLVSRTATLDGVTPARRSASEPAQTRC